MNFSVAVSIKSDKIPVLNFLPSIGIEHIRDEIFEGLQAENKYISSKFFYDENGSRLFEQITLLPEYYPTRTEKQILKNLNLTFISDFNNLKIIEIGSGDHSKISLLLHKIPQNTQNQTTYIPLDISATAIEQAGKALLNLFPKIQIQGIVADFMKQLDCIPDGNNRLFCFLGSTIGNFTQEQTNSFMLKISEIMKPGEFFLVGFDSIKNKEILENAYNDKHGITAKFNLNILNVINQLAETNFNVSDFKHVSFYNTQLNRIEMHLEALTNVTIESKYLSKNIYMRKGDRIHTENSYKFDSVLIEKIATKSDFMVHTIFTDPNNWFHVALLKKREKNITFVDNNLLAI